MTRENVNRVLLLHAEYSFSEINWNFNLLTDREKELIGSQKTLDEIKRRAEKICGKPLLEVFANEEEPPLFV